MDRIANERDYHARQLKAIGDKYDERIERGQEVLDDRAAKWEHVWGQENRLPRYSSPVFYWPFLTVLAICEVPVNRLSFELFFAETPLLSIVVSALVGVLLIALAHFFGLTARRIRYFARRNGLPTQILILASCGLLIYIISYGLAVMRQGYLRFVMQEDPTFAQALETGGVAQAATLVLQTGLALEGAIFLVINLGIVGVGVLAAFYCHDPHPDFERIDRERKAADADLAKLKRQKTDEVVSEERRHSAAIKRIELRGR